MIKTAFTLASATLLVLALPGEGWAQNRGGGPGGGANMRPPGAGGVPGAQHRGYRGASEGQGYGGARHGYPAYGYRPAYRPGYAAYGRYPGWGGGYWGPRAAFYWGAPALWGPAWPWWGAWPLAVGTVYSYSYNVAPLLTEPTAQTQLFVQQQAPAPAAPATAPNGYWYYCTQPAGYFPYVKDCTEPWLKVIPAPPGQQPTLPGQS
ncbi:MAG: hypothetical protein ABIR94_13185 [Rubrivivax sp.]